MASSQSMSSQSNELNYQLLMPADLFIATIEGNRDVLVQRLELEPKEQTETKVTMDQPPHSGDTKNLRTVQAELRSATLSGDTVLHLLVNRKHNELALMVFQRDMSLWKEKNKMSETPLHYAAKAGNKEVIKKLIQNNPDIVKDALEEINVNGDNAFHIATRQGHKDCVLEFLKLNKEILYKVNNEIMFSPLHIAITKGHTDMVIAMLDVDHTLGYTKLLPNDMFPVQLIARTGNAELVIHFIKRYPDHVGLLDFRGKNIFHIAAEENHKILFSEIFTRSLAIKEMAGRMNNAVDYEGNTPMHIAAMKGHTSIVRVIWENKTSRIAETVQNNKGLTPFEASLKQLGELSEREDGAKIRKYLRTEGHKFTAKWFDDIVGPTIADKWEKIQVIGLGSVLITTVTFAASFTFPGGYDHGTPILGWAYMFRAFMVVNSMAFIEGFLSLFALLGNVVEGPSHSALTFAILAFKLAASNMILAFGLGMYVTLAFVSSPISIFILVLFMILTLPIALYDYVGIGQNWIHVVSNIGMRKPLIMYCLSIVIGLGLAFL